MDIKKKIKSLVQEAELYQRQGLNPEALGNFQKVMALVQKHKQIKNADAFLAGISKKIKVLEDVIDKKKNEPAFMEMSKTAQDVVRDVLSHAHGLDDEHAALEGAIALTKFGQFRRALEEFEELIHKESLRVVVAKNMLRCHLSLSSEKEAIAQYEKWLADDSFPADQLGKVRMFLEGLLRSKGLDQSLPKTMEELEAADGQGAEPTEIVLPEEPEVLEEIDSDEGISLSEEEVEAAGRGEPVAAAIRPPSIEMPKGIDIPDMDMDDEVLDVSSVGITVDRGAEKGKLIEIDVNFQSEDRLTIIVQKGMKDIIDMLKIGAQIEDMQFYSPIAMFAGTGTIMSNKQIDTGPKRGDHSVDIKIIGH
jgi:hypothetical protein